MKLILAIVSNDDASCVSKALNKERFQVTKLATTGGFLSLGNTTLICGCEDNKVDDAIKIISSESKRRTEISSTPSMYDAGRIMSVPVEVTVGGATIFVLDVDKFVKV